MLLAGGQGDEILDRDALEADGLLEGEGNALVGALGDRQIRDILAVQQDLTRGGGEDTRDDLGEGGLTAAVGACDGHEAVVDDEVYVLEDLGLPGLAGGQGLGDTVRNIFQF